jgi:DNA-binding NtrC family response regulator
VFRLAGITLRVPPLRDRPDEIEPLAKFFARESAADCGRTVAPEFEPAALAALRAQPWKGNVRELKNVVERALLLSDGGTITAKDLAIEGSPEEETLLGANSTSKFPPIHPAAMSSATLPVGPGPSEQPAAPTSLAGLRADVESYEKRQIKDALEQCAGNQSRAAKLLGIGRRTLITKINAYGLRRPRGREDE